MHKTAELRALITSGLYFTARNEWRIIQMEQQLLRNSSPGSSRIERECLQEFRRKLEEREEAFYRQFGHAVVLDDAFA